MLKDNAPKMLDRDKMLEVDEAYIGGREDIIRHHLKRRSNTNSDSDLTNEGSLYKTKKVVLSIIERNGNVVLKYIPNATKSNMVPSLRKHVPIGAKLFIDESKVYNKIYKWYTNDTVKHALGVYVIGEVHTNTIENFWSVLKRSLYGI